MIDIRNLEARAKHANSKESGSPAHFLAWASLSRIASPDVVLELIAELKATKAENERLQSAAKTLTRLGYTDNGGERWKPPLGPRPDFGDINQ